jgi:hypothetical protein
VFDIKVQKKIANAAHIYANSFFLMCLVWYPITSLTHSLLVSSTTSVFDIKVQKKISGAASAPDAVVNFIVGSVIPGVISKVVKLLPSALGDALTGAAGNNVVDVRGSFSLKSDHEAALFEASLDGDDAAAVAARALIPLDVRAARVFATFCRTNGVLVSKSKNAKVSLASLYNYFLQYNTHWALFRKLLVVWDHMLRPLLAPLDNASTSSSSSMSSSFFKNLMRNVVRLGARPSSLTVRLTQLQVSGCCVFIPLRLAISVSFFLSRNVVRLGARPSSLTVRLTQLQVSHSCYYMPALSFIIFVFGCSLFALSLFRLFFDCVFRSLCKSRRRHQRSHLHSCSHTHFFTKF